MCSLIVLLIGVCCAFVEINKHVTAEMLVRLYLNKNQVLVNYSNKLFFSLFCFAFYFQRLEFQCSYSSPGRNFP